jgi:c-di-GMP-binding flagellar brake protein YcgR
VGDVGVEAGDGVAGAAAADGDVLAALARVGAGADGGVLGFGLGAPALADVGSALAPGLCTFALRAEKGTWYRLFMSEERRRKARVSVQLPCTLKGPETSAKGEVLDISTIGAKIVTPEKAAGDDEDVTLVLDGIDVDARVMYARERDGKMVSGVQFMAMDAEAYRAIEAFVEGVLEGDGGGNREHPRVQHRVQVLCKTPKRAKGMLQDISRGGMRVLVEDTVKVGDSLTAEITVGKLKEPLVLTGEVVRVKSDDKGEKHLAGVKLSDVPPDSQRLLDKLLATLLKK